MDDKKKPKPPTHTIFQVIDGKTKEDTRWIRVGAAWTNKDNKGLHCVFDSYPVVGRIVIRDVVKADGASDSRGQ